MVTYTQEVAYPQERDSRALWNLSTRSKGNTEQRLWEVWAEARQAYNSSILVPAS